MTLVYIIASVIAFTANRSWTFRSRKSFNTSALKYALCQIIGYTTNLVILSWLYYTLGVPHQAAQLVGMAVVAIELFLLNRYYVFG